MSVFWATNQLPGRSVAMWSLERQAYQAQAAVLRQPYSIFSPLRFNNTVTAITTDVIYGAAAAGGAAVYFSGAE